MTSIAQRKREGFFLPVTTFRRSQPKRYAISIFATIYGRAIDAVFAVERQLSRWISTVTPAGECVNNYLAPAIRVGGKFEYHATSNFVRTSLVLHSSAKSTSVKIASNIKNQI